MPEKVVLVVRTVTDPSITAEYIARCRWTATDPILSQVLQFVELDEDGLAMHHVSVVVRIAHGQYTTESL